MKLRRQRNAVTLELPSSDSDWRINVSGSAGPLRFGNLFSVEVAAGSLKMKVIRIRVSGSLTCLETEEMAFYLDCQTVDAGQMLCF